MKPTKKTIQDVVVIGGGVAAMQAALTLAKIKHRVSLLHIDTRLGGHAATMPELYGYLADDSHQASIQLQNTVSRLTTQVAECKGIKLYPQTSVKSVQGEAGGFSVKTSAAGVENSLRAGAIVLAPGSGSTPAADALKEKLADAVTDLRGLLTLIREKKAPKRVVILMDGTGSATPSALEQTRTVSAQVFSAAELLAASSVSVKVLCHHARVAATGIESLYRRARNSGVAVIKTATAKLQTAADSKVVVQYDDLVSDSSLSEEFDLAVIADVLPGRTDLFVRNLIAGLRTGPDGALQYDNVWLLPTLTNRPGVFVAGAARGNSELREALTDGLAVAGQVHDLLTHGTIVPRQDIATVDSDKCVLCLTCMRICPHGAISIDNEKKAASVSPISCQRCGICAAECPAVAIQLPGFTDKQTAATIGEKPKVTLFACENSALLAAETVKLKLEAKIRTVKVPCAGKVDPRSVLDALSRGADKVLVLGCHPENCQFLSGSSRASKRMQRLGAALEKAGFDRSRVVFGGLASVEPARLMEYVDSKNAARSGVRP
jgi:heterodisulfide reductase subunit A-like polyferredoxin/coenzyme F420-reducing hydrogenase delta subunit